MAVSTACISIFPPLVGKLQPRFLTAEGSLRVYIYIFFLTLLVPSHYLLCLKLLKELKMLPISLVLSPDPLRVLAAGC